ncbi:MAG: nucleotidyltransferase domain-containing protein [Chthoniobacterales bacterium]
MKDKIQFELSRIEREYGVQILHAAEAGARAWGFAPSHSGHDVRFLYTAQAGKSALVESSGFLEIVRPGLTLRGCDLRRTLDLLLSSHASLLEWLRSPVVYAEDPRFASRLRALAGRFFDAEQGIETYRKLAQRVQCEYLNLGNPPAGKFLEAVRALLAIRYIERNRIPPPVGITNLVDATVDDVSLRFAIADLILENRMGGKVKSAKDYEIVKEFLGREFSRPREYLCDRDAPRASVITRFSNYLKVA